MIPQFVITTAGLNKASVAGPRGPYIDINNFRVGTGYGYQPNAADTGLHGTTLFSGTPTSYAYVDSGTINVVCTIPATAGPFAYGEVGIFQPDGTLFALAAFDAPQQKHNIASSGLPHTVSFNCHLKLAQTPAVFNVTTLTNLNILQVPDYSFITAPQYMVNEPNAVLVTLGTAATATLLIKANDNYWYPTGWIRQLGATVQTHTGNSVYIENYPGNLTNTTGDLAGTQLLLRIDSGTMIGHMVPILLFQFNQINIQSALPSTLAVGTNVSIFVSPVARNGYGSFTAANMWTRLNKVIGPPTFASTVGNTHHVTNDGTGYGQATLSLPSNPPTETQWLQFYQALANYENLYNPRSLTDDFLHVYNAPGSRVIPQVAILKAEEKLGRIETNVGKVHKSHYSWSVGKAFSYDYTAATGWDSLRMYATCTWGSVADATAYFNAGGYVDFCVRSTQNSYLEWMVNRTMLQLGPLRFKRYGVESMGPMRIRYLNGDGYTTSPGPLGLQGITDGQWRRMFSYIVPLNSRKEDTVVPGGFGKSDEILLIEIHARSVGAGILQFELRLLQSTFDHAGVVTPTRPGFIVAVSGSGLAGSADMADPGSYLSQIGTGWDVPNQKINAYMFFGRPSVPWMSVGLPAVTSTAGTVWGTDITTSATTGFGGASSAIE